VDVVGHKDKGRAEKLLAGCRVKQKFPECCVETWIQPTAGASLERNGPKNGCEATVMPKVQTREMVHLRLRGQRRGVHVNHDSIRWRSVDSVERRTLEFQGSGSRHWENRGALPSRRYEGLLIA